jgi:Tfp pilus assembly protein PilF
LAFVVGGRTPGVGAALRDAGLAVAARYTQDAHGRALERALQDCAGATTDPPGDLQGELCDTYNRLGVVLYRGGDLAGARASFLRVLALDPDNADARANVAELPAV